MTINPKTLFMVNLIVQALLMVLVLGAAYLAKRKKNFGVHCSIMRIAVLLQIATIAVVMLPSMLGFLRLGQRGLFFNVEMLVHHGLGLVIIALWVLINLLFMGVIRIQARLVPLMRSAFILWIIVFLLGLHLYFVVWL